MKISTALVLSAGMLSAAPLTSTAETAYTPPVMASSTQLQEGLNVVGVTALNAIEATGVIDSIDSVDGEGYTTLVVTDVPEDWGTYDQQNQGGIVQYNGIVGYQDVPMYYLEVTSGDQQGLILDVVATEAGAENTLTVGTDLTGMDAIFADQTFAVRQKRTIADVFGADNEAGLTGGNSFSSSDLVYVYINGNFEMFYYQEWPEELNNNGWRQISDFETSMDDICVDPDLGLIVYIRNAGTTVNLVTAGDVKTGTARTAFTTGLNPINMKFPVGMTLGSSGLYNGDSENPVLQGGMSFSTADLVYVLIPGESRFEMYYYQEWPEELNNNGWRQISDFETSMDNVEIPSGAMIIVYRRANEATEWTLPQPFSL
ncbi:MAG: TIGR02597 family protein [Puniceicoccales bacterium]